MKTIKKFFAMMFAFVMAVSVFAVAACNQPEVNDKNDNIEQGGTNTPNPDKDKEQDKEIEYVAGTEGLEYTLNNDGKTYSCTGIGTATETEITIASHYNGLLVTSIGESAFEDCESIVSIKIPDSVTSIGAESFCGCISLANITIANSVVYIDNKAFAATAYFNNESNWENSVLYIGNYLIEGWVSGSYSIKAGTRAIASSAFTDCASITCITIPDSVIGIGSYAFYWCTSLASIVIPDSVTHIGNHAFYNTAYYNDESNWSNNVLYIGNHLIEAKTSLTGCYSIRYGTRTIADYAFSGCKSLTSITIPDSVTSIGLVVFYECIAVYITDIASWCNISFGDIYPSFYHGYNLYLNNKLVNELEIPNGVISIGCWAFYNCISLTSITIPDSVISIGMAAFFGCASLESCTIGNGVTSIGWEAFAWCESLTNITIPNSVISIGAGAFYNCTSLTSVIIGNSVTSISMGAFDYCSSLESINYNGTTEQWSAIPKSLNWDLNTANYTIYCTDGTIAKDGTVTK